MFSQNFLYFYLKYGTLVESIRSHRKVGERLITLTILTTATATTEATVAATTTATTTPAATTTTYLKGINFRGN